LTTPRELSAAEFAACFDEPMLDVTDDEDSDLDIDIWPYVDALDPKSLGVESFDDVDRVYQDARGRYDQIIIETDRPDIFLVVVVDIEARSIHGHRLLDLNVEYGLIPKTD
jgi:hypothetical protein